MRKASLAKLQNPARAIQDALADSVASPPLSELARGRASACILICDITRPVPNRLFLRPMIETIIAAGVPREAISVLIATGLHRPNVGDELAELIGDSWVLANARIENHDARDDALHVDLGRTKTRGVPVRLNRLFVGADLKIATGLVGAAFHGWLVGRPESRGPGRCAS